MSDLQTREAYATALERSADDPEMSLMLLERIFVHDEVRRSMMIRGSESEQNDAIVERGEAILRLGQAVTFFAKHGILNPLQLGAWLAEPSEQLVTGGQKQRPIRVLIHMASTDLPFGPPSFDIRQVVESGRSFLRPDHTFFEDLRRLETILT